MRTGLRVMSPSAARPTSLPVENLPSLPELAPVPEWSPPSYLPGGPPPGGFSGFSGLGGPAARRVRRVRGVRRARRDRRVRRDRRLRRGPAARLPCTMLTAQAVPVAPRSAIAATRPGRAGRRRDRGGRRVPVLLLALAFVLTAGIGITLGSWLGFPGQADSGQQPGVGSAASGSGRAVGGGGAHGRRRRGAHASRPAGDPGQDP